MSSLKVLMKRAIAAQRHKRHVLLARPLDASTAHDALGVGEQHYLQQHRWWIRRRARHVVPKPRIEVREIDRPVEQMIERVLERARQELLGQIDGQESRIRIDVL